MTGGDRADDDAGTGDWAGHWDVVVVGGRLAGAVTAHALAPWARRILLVERSRPGSFWPQQVTWDRRDNLIWEHLGLATTVLGCGAPRLRGHTRRTLDVTVEYEYPDDDEHCYRMSVSREVLDPALAARAAQHENVTLLRPARSLGALTDGGRVTGVRVLHGGVTRDVTADLVVFADGRLSRHPEQIGAATTETVPSPWTALISYAEDLPLPVDHAWYSRQPGSMVVVTPTGPRQWCVAAALHGDLLAARGMHPVRLYHDVVAADPDVGPAVAMGRATTSVGGVGRLRMHRRPMAGPGWCLVGDSGLHLDPMTALGTHAVLTTARLLRDRVAALGRISTDPADYADLTALRDGLLRQEWELTRTVIAAYRPGAAVLARARQLAVDASFREELLRTQLGLPPVRAAAAGAPPVLTTGGRR